MRKVGVDPYNDDTGCHAWDRANKEALIAKIDPQAVFYRMTSDGFFRTSEALGFYEKSDLFDLIYIDGLHLEEQVDKDIANALRFVSPSGMIVLDDVPPANEYEESIILPYRQQTPVYENADFPNPTLSFEFLKAYEDELLNNISQDEFFKIIGE